MKKIPMTVEGETRLRAELEQLKRVERPRIIQAIAESRAHGDLKENAEYHAAREQQGFIEGRIQDIEAKFSRLQVIDVGQLPATGRVIFGVTVSIIDAVTEKNLTYKIVGDDEANARENKISYQSPIARALMGREVGDVVTVKTPSGEFEYEISRVEHI